MRRLFAVGFILGLAGTTAPAAWQTPQRNVWMTITPSLGGGQGSFELTERAVYIGPPFVFVATEPPARGGEPELTFGMRAWKEGDKARVVVYAVLLDKRAPEGRTQTPISTFLIDPGKAVEVKEPVKWGGTPVTVGSEIQVRR